MKKIIILLAVITFNCACYFTHISETVIGINEEGKTLVQFCKSKGTLKNTTAFGSSCTVELRDYGKITFEENTVNNEETNNTAK